MNAAMKPRPLRHKRRTDKRQTALRLPGAAALGLALLLTACAAPDSVAPGSTRALVLERHGAPQARHALPDGGERLEYGSGPLQQFTWMVDLDREGRVSGARQVRTLENFNRLRIGIDDRALVEREFGSPWRIEHYRLSGRTAWLYPYREAGVWNSMVAVHFDAAGRVQQVQNGPDPRFLGGGGRDD